MNIQIEISANNITFKYKEANKVLVKAILKHTRNPDADSALEQLPGKLPQMLTPGGIFPRDIQNELKRLNDEGNTSRH